MFPFWMFQELLHKQYMGRQGRWGRYKRKLLRSVDGRQDGLLAISDPFYSIKTFSDKTNQFLVKVFLKCRIM